MTELSQATAQFEAAAFRTLNAVVEPLVSAGLGGPLFTPFGAVVLESTGRKTGAIRRTPLLATVIGAATVVATYRGDRSQWVKNLAARPAAAWWTNGQRREGRSILFAPKLDWPATGTIPEGLRTCAETTWRALVGAGWAVAVLVEEE